jgi:hypothetical protein
MSTKISENKRVRRLPKSLHPGIETVWEKSFPTKEMLTIHDYTPESISTVTSSMPGDSLIEIDKTNTSYKLSTKLPSNMPNEWDEMVNISRISYGVSRKWIPQSFKEIQDIIGKKKCKPDAAPLDYASILKIIKEKDFKDVTNRVFHDAVEAVARIWFRAWNIFTSP